MQDRDVKGRREFLDPTPVAVPVGFRQPPSLQTQIQMMVQRELSAAAAAQGFETFEEADYFGDNDDEGPDFNSRWEIPADAPDRWQESRVRNEIREEVNRRFPPQGGNGPAPPAGAAPAPAGAGGSGGAPKTGAP